MGNYEIQKQRVDKLAAKWIKPLGLAWWEITIEGVEERFLGDNEGSERAFNVTWLPEYMEATIRFYVPTIADIDDGKLEKIFVHELMHLFLAELTHECDDMEWHIEHICTRLANAFIWAVDMIREHPAEQNP